ncbi:MAG TPA: hypothetical protein VFC45_05185 [Pseudolabrys sp.]|nr:hypothetical protein [Pseudolabrys sp.]
MAQETKPKRSQAQKPQPRMLTNLHALTKSLAEMADHVASLDILTDDEKETLVLNRDQLGGSVDELTNIFAAHDALQMGDTKRNKPFDPHGPMLLSVALTAAFQIGSRAVENPIMKRIEQQAKKARTAHATQVRLSTSELTTRLIRKLIEPILNKTPGLPNASVAEKILNPLNEHLTHDGKRALKLDTVQRKIKKLRTTVRSSV